MNNDLKLLNEKETDSILKSSRVIDNWITRDDVYSEENYNEENFNDLKDKYKKQALEYYKKNGNLNDLIFSAETPEVKMELEKWMLEFFIQLSDDKKNTNKSNLISNEGKKICNE